AYMTGWKGPLQEGESSPVRKHLQGMSWLPAASAGGNDAVYINNVKAAITGYGALYATIYYDYNAFKSNYTNFYNSKCTNGPYGVEDCGCSSGGDCGGHSIALVGWNDSYAASNFTTTRHGTPPGPGAFLAKNSWGTDSGAAGYFYISYYDTSIGGETALFDFAQATANYTTVYQYDPLGYSYDMGNGDVNGVDSYTEWMSNLFTAASSGYVRAAGFYTTDVNVSYELYVYTGVAAGSPRSGALAYSVSGTFAAAGYHTVPVPQDVVVGAGGTFSLVVKLTNSSYSYPLPVEYKFPDYSSGASASAGQSFYSSNGTAWADLTALSNSYYNDDFSQANVCLKAYVDADSTPPLAISNVYDGSAAGVDISKSNSASQLSANWTASSDPESGIVRYDYAIGTVSGTPGVKAWTSAGASLSVTATGLSLADGATYYFGVLAVNGLGAESAATWSDGQYVDISTPEEAPYLYDGTGADTDYATSLTTLSANWGASPSPGASAYYYAVGATAGAADVVPWASAGTALAVTETGLSLSEGSTYYFSVKAYNSSSGYYSPVVSSDGQLVDTISPTARVVVNSSLPAANGSFSAQLIVTESNALAATPVFYFTTSGGLRVVPALSRVNPSTWTATAYIETYYSTGTAAFHFSGTDPAGHTGTFITSGGTFTIDSAVSGTSGGSVSNADGMGVTVPAGAYPGNLLISVSTVAASRTDPPDAASASSVELPAYDLVREFRAVNSDGFPVTIFSRPLTITLAYPDADNDGRIDGDLAKENLAWIYYLDETLGKWTPVDGVTRNAAANTLAAQVTHFSVYSVRAAPEADSGMSGLKAYPNPFDLRRDAALVIAGIPADAAAPRVYIYNEAAELVRTLSPGHGLDALNTAVWDGRLTGGGRAATGLYLYLVRTANYGKGSGKFFLVW
ncbi:MAG TPA: lectin like domain-containing protein, partial [Elusimicrobiales bacterium]|nr:lectin like domain-containing protein [Elusimicrobiales bacterium]